MAQVLHFDCFSGVSGDMTLAALLDLGVPETIVQEAVGSLGLEGKLIVRRVRKNGFDAIKVDVEHPHEHAHRHLSHIKRIIDGGRLNDSARGLAHRMFERLADAEAKSHGVSIEKVHFHEVGAVDSIYDFVGVATAIAWLNPSRITSRPVPTGGGWVDCEHGRLPVPAPAVARLLEGIPLAPSSVESELTTPTGAAIVATLVGEFVAQPALTIRKVGLGAGTRELAGQPNLLRLYLADQPAGNSPFVDFIWEVRTNLDDVAPQVIGYCVGRLFEAGALDVFTQSIQMKKDRSGVLLSVLCDDDKLPVVEEILFRETGTLGIRKCRLERSKLDRQSVTVETPWGPVRCKVGTRDAIGVSSPEYDDCSRIALQHQVPIRTVQQTALRQLQDMLGRAGHSGLPAGSP